MFGKNYVQLFLFQYPFFSIPINQLDILSSYLYFLFFNEPFETILVKRFNIFFNRLKKLFELFLGFGYGLLDFIVFINRISDDQRTEQVIIFWILLFDYLKKIGFSMFGFSTIDFFILVFIHSFSILDFPDFLILYAVWLWPRITLS